MNAAYHRQFFTNIRFTILVTLGLLFAAFGVDDRLALALPVAPSRGSGSAGAAYPIALAVVTVIAVVVGVWWFVGGEGEPGLRRVLDESFAAD